MSSFRTPYTTPTSEQAALIGHVVMDWAIIENNLRHLVRRLAMMPELPGRIVTDRMSPSIAEAKIDDLLLLHEKRYRDEIISYENRLAIAAAMKIVKPLRSKRNIFAHRTGLRLSDEDMHFFSLDIAFAPEDKPKAAKKAEAESKQSLGDLNSLIADIRRANEALEAVIALIPRQAERL